MRPPHQRRTAVLRAVHGEAEELTEKASAAVTSKPTAALNELQGDSDMNISDTCNAAADLIEVRGWTTGGEGWGPAVGDHQSSLCLEGAIAAAAGIDDLCDLVLCPARRAVKEYLDTLPWAWNDKLIYQHSGNPHPDNSPESNQWAAEQVIATLRAVAVIHAAREDETATIERDAATVTA